MVKTNWCIRSLAVCTGVACWLLAGMIANAQEIDSALAVLRSEPDLAGADLVLLQEIRYPGDRGGPAVDQGRVRPHRGGLRRVPGGLLPA